MTDSLQLEIRRPGRPPQAFEVTPGTYTVGSEDECAIRLAHPDVEPRHAILAIRTDSCHVEDLDTESGTYLEDRRITGHAQITTGQNLRIGPFQISIQKEEPHSEPPRDDGASDNEARRAESGSRPPSPPEKSGEAASPATGTTTDPDKKKRNELKRSIKQQIHKELVERLNIKRLTASRINQEDLQEKALSNIREIVQEVRGRLPAEVSTEDLITEIYDEALRLGPLEEFLADPEINEIMVNGPDQIYIEKKGKIVRTDRSFMDSSSVIAVIERIVSPIGRRIDESQPYVDARLPDGSRVNAVIPPLSLVGPCLTIRKFSQTPFTDSDLIRLGTLTSQIARFAEICIKVRKNIVVSGGTGSGKTTLLNVLSNYLPEHERIITVEDAAELRLVQPHVIRLESRPPNIEGKGAVTIRDLVRNSLRMRPDRIVVGECRGGETLDMLQAMNTGHDGSLTTVHANSPRDVISRLETMVLMSGMELPVRAIREQIAAAIDLIVHESRLSDGSRKVTRVTEVAGLEGDQVTMQDIFVFRQTGIDEQGNVQGHFEPTGAIPTFLEEIESRGLKIDRAMFA
jgi:pilus assembly protein CpaF